MTNTLVFGIAALASLVPASILPFRRVADRPDLLFWALLATATAGPMAFALIHLGTAWQSGFSATLWVSVAASLAVFALAAAVTRDAWRLAPLLLPYLCILGLCAVIWSHRPDPTDSAARLDAWLAVHIMVSIATYALATLAAVAGAAVFLQERALRRKELTGLTRLLPSIADAEALEVRLLLLAECVLGVGIVTGMAWGYLHQQGLLIADHKTIFALLAFCLIGALLLLHHRTGLRGRRAARGVLLAYLLLTLAYPGVKFVTDVLIG